jgi:hypothetical protein
MRTGDKILFGSYTWRVLEIRDNAALILTDEIIERRFYHNTREDVTWADCDLRHYLNGEFYEKFNETDKEKILCVTDANPSNPWFGTSGGKDTQDKIFLLTIEDAVCKYFGDSSNKLQNRNINHNYWFQGKKDINDCNRIAEFEGSSCWWWLRSPGRTFRSAAYIHGDTGGVGINGNPHLFSTKCTNSGCGIYGGIRPALWMKLM